MNWWEKAPHRLSLEVTLMEQKFPQFQLGHSKSNRVINNMITLRKDQKYWLGKLRTISGKIYKVLLTYPEYYPGSEIKAYILNPKITHRQHRYHDGHLCLYSNDHGGRGQGTGPAMTAISFVGWVAAWLHGHEIYEETGIWPDNSFFNRTRA